MNLEDRENYRLIEAEQRREERERFDDEKTVLNRERRRLQWRIGTWRTRSC